MLPKGRGTILLTGASASVKGYPQSAVFAMGKFALRGLAQSLARELSPKGIHVAHFVIDGSVRNSARGRTEAGRHGTDSYLDPDRDRASLSGRHAPASKCLDVGKSSSGPGGTLLVAAVNHAKPDRFEAWWRRAMVRSPHARVDHVRWG